MPETVKYIPQNLLENAFVIDPTKTPEQRAEEAQTRTELEHARQLFQKDFEDYFLKNFQPVDQVAA